ncbi:ATP-grasp domain-containing protein [Clostridium botulinum]|uniref:ATP-grasp domain-containing protein n=1 Tax=Clostridium botulinum TaxID=1491 RepID=UPI0013CC95CF|nr:ATP-grasp domain-containing protein [Clostridium botulinum]MBY6836408.1 ATP-grasp domain-containing protein [Clostridium botulinum]NFG64252.1 ATP-grasp domain-containing protein [Clostridium botulinum]NFN18145.1 ATP-grasp domain-containing protein [Clostridium botulinum]NFN47802.1 ATP-grasp domain-containing protein [Clostridium botulinum]NFQ23024.1 ATP-grasp domain-containing protein [Clostridium botulinum]
MKTLLILGAGKEQVPAIIRAKNKGIYTIVLDMNPEAEGFKYADEHHIVSIRDEEALINFARKYDKKIDGVITIASDIPHMVSRVAEELGVKHIPIEAADLAVNKFKMKEALKKAGVNVPHFRKISSIEDLKKFISEYDYPVVIKPVDNSGARGVLILTENVDLSWAFDESKSNSRSGDVMVEKFLEGPQMSTEGIMYEDNFYITGFADRNYDKLEKFFPNIIEDGGDSPTALSQEAKELVNIEFEKAVRVLGINWGPGKGDMIYSNGKAYVVEIAARLSGGNFCYDHVPLGTGVDIVDAYINMAVDNTMDIECFKPKFEKGVAQRYFFPGTGKIKKIVGLDKVKDMESIKKIDFFVEEGEIIEKQANHTTRVGYVIAVGKDKKEAVKFAEEAIKSVEFIFE